MSEEQIAIGIDIGGTNLRAALVTSSGRILQRLAERSDPDPEIALGRICALIAALDQPDLTAIGVGVPGRVDSALKQVLSGGYLDLSRIDTASEIEKCCGKPVVIDNDANMALLAELAMGAAKAREHVAMLTIGTGIGGALFENGRIFHGRRTAGQLGHIVVNAAGRPCLCGRRGCVETESSGTALGRHMIEAGFEKGLGADALLALARNGDAKAMAVIKAWSMPLKAAIDTLAAAFDPELVVLGGGLGKQACEALSLLEAPASWFEVDIRPATLGDDAGMIGAALAALAGQADLSAPKAAHSSKTGKRLLMVNGIPATGKSRVSHGLSQMTGWPVLALDTVKNPFLAHIDNVDRLFNRTLGKASYQAIFSIIRDAPEGSTFIVDAWFGFQPIGLLQKHLDFAGITALAEIWCHAPGAVLAERYSARLGDRPAGHPGASYIPELVELAKQARPTGLCPVFELDTTGAADNRQLADWASSHLESR